MNKPQSWHDRAHGGCLGFSEPFIRGYGLMTAEWYARVQAQRDRIPEHLDRECVRCGWKWAEGIVA